MPQQSFRKPSASALDRTQSDPTASETTPKLGFRWKKDCKLSKDYVCSLSGKSTNPDGSKRKNREPDITIALFRHLKEITIYEPNLSRVDMEDPKGLEVVLLLGAIVIREVFNSNMRETFNITESSRRNSAENAPHTSPLNASSNPPPPPRRHHHSSSTAVGHPPTKQQATSRPPPTDPRSQWELDAETVRLRKAVEHEERERRRVEHAETKRVKRMLAEEERKAREKQKDVDRETERLKKLYGKHPQQLSSRPPQPPARHSMQPPSQSGGYPVTSYPPAPMQRPHSAAPAPYIASNLHNQRPTGPYLQPQDVGSASGYVGPSSSSFFSGASSGSRPAMVPKKSFWGLRGGGGGDNSRLTKQKSTVF